MIALDPQPVAAGADGTRKKKSNSSSPLLGTGANDRAGQEGAKPLHVCHLVGWGQADMGCPETAELTSAGAWRCPCSAPCPLQGRQDSDQLLAKDPANESPALGEHSWEQHQGKGAVLMW